MSKQVIRVLSFDPGLVHLGWTFSEYDREQNQMVVLDYGTLTPGPVAATAKFRNEVASFSKRVISCSLIRLWVDELVTKFNPDFCTSEDAFYCSRMPNAFSALVQCLTTMENLLYVKFKRALTKMSPKEIKHCISGSGTSGKVSVQDAVMRNPNIQFKVTHDLLRMCEHEADSIAVGWTFTQLRLPGMLYV